MTLTVNEGDFISLLGPSGCGKSTALRLIAGLMPPTPGRILWTGGAQTRRSGRGVSGTHADALGHGGAERLAAVPPARHNRCATRCARDHSRRSRWSASTRFADAYPRELSGGMKMRVSIARALVTNPRLILMDEPFAALDEITRQKLNNDLLAMKAKIGCTVIFVTHSVFESVFLSDRIVVMAARPGRVIRELAVDAPYPRDMAFRTSAEYAAHCRAASEALHRGDGRGSMTPGRPPLPPTPPPRSTPKRHAAPGRARIEGVGAWVLPVLVVIGAGALAVGPDRGLERDPALHPAGARPRAADAGHGLAAPVRRAAGDACRSRSWRWPSRWSAASASRSSSPSRTGRR